MAQAAIQKPALLLLGSMSHLVTDEKQAARAEKWPARAEERCFASGATKQRVCEALAMNCQGRAAAEVCLPQQQPNVLTGW